MIKPVSGLAKKAQATTIEQLAKSYGDWNGIRANHVMNSAGHMVDEQGSSRGLSTKDDRELLIALREQSDAVIVDAATARSEKYKALRNSLLVIVSRSGNFREIPATKDSTRVLLASPIEAVIETGVTDKLVIDPADPFVAIAKWASANSLRKLLLEGGPTLSKLAFENSHVIQSALTITPSVMKTPVVPITHPFDSSAQLISLADTEDASFSFWSHERRGS
jgi:riboflavin biosynthesis pyrimidine reductase